MKKSMIPVIIFLFAAIALGLGIWQLYIYVPSQLKMIADALDQGAPKEQITDYKNQQFIPQVISYVITSFGFVAVLISVGLLSLKKCSCKMNSENPVITVATEDESIVAEDDSDDDSVDEEEVDEEVFDGETEDEETLDNEIEDTNVEDDNNE